MIKTRQFIAISFMMAALLAGAWAMAPAPIAQDAVPFDFDEDDPRDHPDLTNVDLSVVGLSGIGNVFMIEGIDNETSVVVEDGAVEPGGTRYARLVVHGVFDQKMREWRNEIIEGENVKRDIEVNLNNQSNSRVLRITFHDCWPARFTIPPLNVDGSTRYVERYEFAYTDFEITD